MALEVFFSWYDSLILGRACNVPYGMRLKRLLYIHNVSGTVSRHVTDAWCVFIKGSFSMLPVLTPRCHHPWLKKLLRIFFLTGPSSNEEGSFFLGNSFIIFNHVKVGKQTSLLIRGGDRLFCSPLREEK